MLIYLHLQYPIYLSMKNSETIQKQLKELFIQLTGSDPLTISPIAEGGSSREYFRLNGKDNKSYIGTYSNNILENQAFFSFGSSMKQLGLSVPEVFAINEEQDCYLQSDLGDVSLFNFIQNQIDKDSFVETLTPLFKNVLDELILFQVKAHPLIDYTKAWPSETFNAKSIVEDLNYFRYYFVKLHPEIIVNELKLMDEFSAFATFLAEAPSNFFMYRDFQSRNILIHETKNWFIDFQGGRKGPLQYDVISLLYQVKARLPQPMRDQLINHYINKLHAYIDTKSIRFEYFFPFFIYLRIMQVLGAYGFRGIIQKKQHFLQSIPYAIFELDELMERNPLPDSLHEMKSVLSQIVKLKSQYFLEKKEQSSKLTVSVNSFSYIKGGIPVDNTANGGGFVFDCRSLPNPGREVHFKMLTGKDAEVIEYLEKKNEVFVFLENIEAILNQAIENYKNRNFLHLMVSFGCTGGQHRSVYCAEKTAMWIKTKFPDIQIILNHLEQKTT